MSTKIGSTEWEMDEIAEREERRRRLALLMKTSKKTDVRPVCDIPLVVTTSIDVRRLPAIRSRLKISQRELARRIGARSDDISRIENAVQPGGLLDLVIDGLNQAAAELERADPRQEPPEER